MEKTYLSWAYFEGKNYRTNKLILTRKLQTLIAVVYATTSGLIPSSRIIFKICTGGKPGHQIYYIQTNQSFKLKVSAGNEIISLSAGNLSEN